MTAADFDFDRSIERRGGDSVKWNRYGPDVLPLWVADMDFLSPEPIRRALRERTEHGVYGYGVPLPPLAEQICARLEARYRWRVSPEQLVFLPGLVVGLNAVCRALGEPGDGVLVHTPVYPPFLSAPAHQQRGLQTAELALTHQDGRLHYELDDDAFVAAMTPRTRLFILCHPHNPVGRGFTVAELERLAALCTCHDLVICSDEIHGDLLLDGREHRPLASLHPDIARRCITLMAPSKTFNIAGLGISFAIVPDPGLRRRLAAAMAGIVAHINVFAFAAAMAAYSGECDDWLQALLRYLTANRDCLLDYLQVHLPGLRSTRPEATCLAWLDCRRVGIPGNPYRFFLEKARVAFNDGATFGPGGDGFVRLNFGCPRALLLEALARMRAALATVAADGADIGLEQGGISTLTEGK